ncbi:hypothetical protein [Rhodococcus sp. no. 34]
MLSQQVPEPSPTVSEQIKPTPIQIEPHFNLPPEVIEKLTISAPGGLTAPQATLIGSIVTLTAAIIAFCGVLYAQRRTRLNLERQLAVQQRLHDSTRAAEDRRQRRASNLLVAIDALTASDDLHRTVCRLRLRMTYSEDRNAEQEARLHIASLNAQLEMLETRFRLLGLEDSGEAIQILCHLASLVVDAPRKRDTEDLELNLDNALERVISTLKNDVKIEPG